MNKYMMAFMIILTLFFSACGANNEPEEVVAAVVETAVSTNTSVPLPTDTPPPTHTPIPEPTETPIPTNTPTSEPTATATATPVSVSKIAFAFYNEEDNAYQLGVMNADGSERIEFPAAIRTLPDGHKPDRPGYGVHFSWSPDGSRIIFGFMNDGITSPRDPDVGDKSYQLAIMDADGSNLVEIPVSVKFNVYRSDPVYSWSPDGGKLAFVSDDDDELYLINADGTDLLLVESVAELKSQPDYDGHSSVFGPSWSPDGNHIAFVWDKNVMSVNLSDSLLTTIIRPTPPPSSESTSEYWGDPNLTWSPDGKWIVNTQSTVYLYQHDSPHEVIQISPLVGRNWNWSSDANLLLGQVTDYDDQNFPTEPLILNMADKAVMPNSLFNMGDYLGGFSPDDTQIMFHSERNGHYDMYVVDIDGANLRQLTDTEPFESNAGWSPDGAKILFTQKQNDSNDIYLVKVEGAEVVQLTETAVDEFKAAWQPLP